MSNACGETHVDVIGMPRDAIFRISSMTKLITAAPMTAPAEWMRRLGSLPLMHQPGEKWM